MALNLTEILNVRLPAKIFPYARKKLGLLNAVGKDYSTQPGQKGAIVPWGVARSVAASPVVPGPYRASTSQLAVDAAGIVLSNYNAVPLTWTDTNQMFQQIEQTFDPATVEAGNAIADAICQEGWNAIGAAYPQGYVGTIGTAFNYAFLTSLSQAADAARFGDRWLVANRSNVMEMGSDTALQNYFAFNADRTMLFDMGVVPGVAGWNVAIDVNQPTKTAVGTGTGYITAAAYAAGTVSIVTATGSGTFIVGDLIRLTGDTNTYQVIAVSGSSPAYTLTLSTPSTSASSPATGTNVPYSGAGGTIAFNPSNGGLQQSAATGTAITILAARGGSGGLGLYGSYPANQGPVAFDPRGVMHVMRAAPVAVVDKLMLATPAVVVDGQSGMVFNFAAYQEYHQVTVEVTWIDGYGVRSELVIPVLR